MRAVPPVTLHRGSLGSASKIIAANLLESGTIVAGDPVHTMLPYRGSLEKYFIWLSEVMGIPLIIPGVYIQEINLALQPVREAMPETPPVPPLDSPLLIGEIANITGTEGVAIVPNDASNAFSGAEIVYSLAGAPLDLVIAPSTGVITGIPLTAGLSTSLVVTATNSASAVPSLTFSADIAAVPIIPVSTATETVGAVGAWGPAGYDDTTIPADLAAMTGITATPLTVWSPNSFMTLGDASSCHWDGLVWVVGVAPTPLVASKSKK